jgi:2-oxoglutarate ferredoxin oxidoreductase subunit beta
VAQTADWAPGHLYATLKAAHRHKGFSFVRVLQRCPIWTPDIFQQAAQSLELTELLVHPDGISEPDVEALYPNHVPHDPKDIVAARSVASAHDKIRLGLFFLNRDAPCYDETRQLPLCTAEEKIDALNAEFDRYAV